MVELGVWFTPNPAANGVTVFDTTANLYFGTTNGTAGSPHPDATGATAMILLLLDAMLPALAVLCRR